MIELFPKIAEILPPNYLSTLRKTAREQGSNGLVKEMGRPVKLSPAQLRQAQRWVELGLTGQGIARRLQVSDTMISRLVGGRRTMPEPVQDELPDTELPDTDVDIDPEPVVAEHELREQPESVVPEPVDASCGPVVAEVADRPAGSVVGSSRLAEATVGSRYAGAMMLHAFFDRVGAHTVFASLPGADPVSARSRRFDDVALLTATAVAFALGWIGCPSCLPCGPGWASWPKHVIRCGSRPTWPPR